MRTTRVPHQITAGERKGAKIKRPARCWEVNRHLVQEALQVEMINLEIFYENDWLFKTFIFHPKVKETEISKMPREGCCSEISAVILNLGNYNRIQRLKKSWLALDRGTRANLGWFIEIGHVISPIRLWQPSSHTGSNSSPRAHNHHRGLIAVV